MSATSEANERPDYDPELQAIADYVLNYQVASDEALETARYCLMDTLGCGLLALRFPECTKHLGPIVEGTVVPFGSRIPGTSLRLDPVKAAWDIGCIIRWLDYNDTCLPPSGGTLPTILARYSPLLTTFPSSGLHKATLRLRCAMCSTP